MPRRKRVSGVFPPPLQGSPGGGRSTQGSSFGSTLGYIPAAASRLKTFVISPLLHAMRHTLAGIFSEESASRRAGYRFKRT